MIRALFAAAYLLLLVVLWLLPADARMHHPARGHRIVAGGGIPLDTASGAYSFRKLRSAYAGFAVKLQRVDTTTQDIGFVGSDFDVAAAAAFCTTACTVQTWYDQSGNGRNLVQATAANQPAYVASCVGAKPCMQYTVGTQVLQAAATITPASGTVSFSGVGQRAAGVGAFTMLAENGAAGNRLAMTGTASTWAVAGGTSGSVQAAATDGGWHAMQAVLSGAASLVNIDGTETTGTATGSVTAALPRITGPASTTANEAEVIFWDNYSLTPAERIALNSNQQNYWMQGPLDNFTQPGGVYSLRRVRSAYSGPGVKLQRVSDSAVQDINFLGFTGFTGAPLDMAAANAFCTTACGVQTWYDQSGNARDLVQATLANQPAFVFDCNNALPCVRQNTATQIIFSASPVVPATGVVSIGAVARRSGAAASSNCTWLRQDGSAGNRLTGSTTANLWLLSPGSTLTATATEGLANWHAGLGVVNGASSVLNIDGVETTGTATGVTTSAPVAIAAAPGTATCDVREAMYWDNYVLTPAERAGLVSNQRGFWGF